VHIPADSDIRLAERLALFAIGEDTQDNDATTGTTVLLRCLVCSSVLNRKHSVYIVRMAEVRGDHEIVTKFLLKTCTDTETQLVNFEALFAFYYRTVIATLRASPHGHETDIVPVTTGSVAEFYIEPTLSCVGDIDIMCHLSDELAIPAGTAPPTQLPDEFQSSIEVCEIVDSEFPGYVYLVSSYSLTECSDDGKYIAVQCQLEKVVYKSHNNMQLPATKGKLARTTLLPLLRLHARDIDYDLVYCMRCLSWPIQAAAWPTRRRRYDWPDSKTIDRVVSNGCDVVRVAHRRCRQDEAKRCTQFRLSFSRAEIVLLNSWIPEQQIVYHMLRVFVKTERLTESATDCDVTKLSNYHIKTLMLWACEVKPKSWWTDDVVTLSVALLHTLSVWLTRGRCPHYFIHNCNLFDHPDNVYSVIASRLMSVRKPSLAEWFINNYIRKCAQLCPDNVSGLFDKVSNSTELQKAVSAVADSSSKLARSATLAFLASVKYEITCVISISSLNVRSCLYWIEDLEKVSECLSPLFMYFSALAFLHVAYKTTTGGKLNDELLDVLATIFLRSNDVRRCANARHSSVLSLSQANKLMGVVANESRTVQLIEIELSKAYLYRALRCKDSVRESICCLANVYLAVLYYNTGHYQTAIDHCTLVTRSQDHSQCSSHVVQGELLPKIDDDIDTVLGLSVFYQYVRTAALNQQQQTQHVSVFTTELFAHYLHIRCLSVMKCRQPKTSLTDKVQRYQKYFRELREIFTTDLLLLILAKGAKCSTNDQRQMVASVKSMPGISDQLETSELVELLQQTAVTCLTVFGAVESMMFSPIGVIVKTDFEALYAYKCGEYERCLQLSTQNVRTLIGVEGISRVVTYPEFIQLMDDDIVSLIALMMIINPSCKVIPLHVSLSQLNLSLYLMAQCQTKLHHPMKSLVQTRDYVQVARRKRNIRLDRLLLKLTERKIMLYRSSDVKDSRPVWSRGFLLGIGLTVGLGLALGLMKYWFHVF